MTENGSQLNENPPETLTVHSTLERCVDYIGRVDIDFICALARVDKAEAFQSLKGAIYYDPEKSCFVTAGIPFRKYYEKACCRKIGT